MRLILTHGEVRTSIPVPEGESTLGRHEDCELHLPDASLSKRHARLVRRGRRLTVQDAGSRNGTLVDGVLLSGDMRREAHHGSRIQCGKLELRLEVAPAARLVLLAADAAGEARSWPLAGEALTIGALPENGVQLSGEGVSRQHAQVAWDDGRWVLTDLGSRNGVLVRGQRALRHALEDGDVLLIGRVELRFELAPPDPLESARALARELWADPRRRRVAAAALVVAALLLAVGLVGVGTPPPPPEADRLAWLERTTAELARGDYQAAREELRRARQGTPDAPPDPRHSPLNRALDDVAHTWARIDRRKPDWYLGFPWDTAPALLDKALQPAALPAPLPGGIRDWLEGQRAWVARHARAYDQLREGTRLAETALSSSIPPAQGSLLDMPDLEAAHRAWSGALRTWRSVDPTTPMAGRGRELAGGLQAQALARLLEQVQARLALEDPPWGECLRLIGAAQELAASPQERSQLRALEEDCRREQRDEERYVRVVEVVQARDPSRYGQALTWLGELDPRSRVYRDGLCYAAWIEADRQVRAAEQAWARGEAEYACALLAAVTRGNRDELLGPGALIPVQQQLERWREVAQAWERGRALDLQGQSALARAELQLILRKEPDPGNWFRRQAALQLAHMAERERASLEGRLREGQEALGKRHYDQALARFRAVRDDPACRAQHLARIGEQVREVKVASRLVLHARRQSTSAGSSPELYYRLTLLAEFLPRDDPDLAEVKKLQAAVAADLERRRRRGR